MAETLQEEVTKMIGQLELGLLRKLYKPGRTVIASALVLNLYNQITKSDENQPSYPSLRAEFDNILAQEIEATNDLERKVTLEVMSVVSRPKREIREYAMNSSSAEIVLAVIDHFKEDALFNSMLVMDLYEHLDMEEEAREYALSAIAKLEEHPYSGTNSDVRRILYVRIGDYDNAFEVAVRAHDFGKAEELIPNISVENPYRIMIEASRTSGIYHEGYQFRIKTLVKISADDEEIRAEKVGYLEWQLGKERGMPSIELAQEVGTKDQLAKTYDRVIDFHLHSAEELLEWVNTDRYIEAWQKVQDVASKAFSDLNSAKYSELAGKARNNIVEARDLKQSRES